MAWSLWCVLAAWAGDPAVPVERMEPNEHADEAEPPVPEGPDQPEYNRLTQELAKLAERNAWAGVERTYVKLLATQISPSFKDLMLAANAAKALGNAGAARERLLAAKELQEDPSVFDWLFEIDQNYGAVRLECDPGLGWSLSTEQRPFQPDRIRAVEFAAAAVTESCHFEGMVPVGTYTFCDQELVVKAGLPPVHIDARGRVPAK